MKIAITGANGQLGSALLRNAPGNVSLLPVTRKDFDIRDLKALQGFIAEERPDILINTAAFHNTVECEENRDLCILINSFIPLFMAILTEKYGGFVAFISTDYVFDGEKKGELYYEDDNPNPLNVYGYSKFLGESLISEKVKKFYIFRTSSLFGRTIRKDGNFVLKILNKAKKGETIRVVNDIYMTPTYSEDAARMMWEVIENGYSSGIYHVSNTGVVSWYEFSKKILEISGISGEVRPISHEELGEKIKRPLWSPLGSRKLRPERFWGEALKEYLEVLKDG